MPYPTFTANPLALGGVAQFFVTPHETLPAPTRECYILRIAFPLMPNSAAKSCPIQSRSRLSARKKNVTVKCGLRQFFVGSYRKWCNSTRREWICAKRKIWHSCVAPSSFSLLPSCEKLQNVVPFNQEQAVLHA